MAAQCRHPFHPNNSDPTIFVQNTNLILRIEVSSRHRLLYPNSRCLKFSFTLDKNQTVLGGTLRIMQNLLDNTKHQLTYIYLWVFIFVKQNSPATLQLIFANIIFFSHKGRSFERNIKIYIIGCPSLFCLPQRNPC